MCVPVLCAGGPADPLLALCSPFNCFFFTCLAIADQSTALQRADFVPNSSLTLTCNQSSRAHLPDSSPAKWTRRTICEQTLYLINGLHLRTSRLMHKDLPDHSIPSPRAPVGRHMPATAATADPRTTGSSVTAPSPIHVAAFHSGFQDWGRTDCD